MTDAKLEKNVLLQQQEAFYHASKTKNGAFMQEALHEEFVFADTEWRILSFHETFIP